jgi:hypothetical protein
MKSLFKGYGRDEMLEYTDQDDLESLTTSHNTIGLHGL